MTTYEPGTVIAGYRIDSLIGRGGMAVVYRAEDLRLGRKVALKLLPPQLADNEQFRQRFIQESRLAASLDHPNIVPIYGAGEADGQLYIAMRYVVGHDLKGLLADQGGRLPVEWAVRLVAQVGDALGSAHRAGHQWQLLRGEVAVLGLVRVGEVDAGRGDVVHLLPRARLRVRQVDELHRLRPAEPGDLHGAHGREVRASAPLTKVAIDDTSEGPASPLR